MQNRAEIADFDYINLHFIAVYDHFTIVTLFNFLFRFRSVESVCNKLSRMLHINCGFGISDEGVVDKDVTERMRSAVNIEIKGDRIVIGLGRIEDVFKNDILHIASVGLVRAAGPGGNDSVNVLARVDVSKVGILDILVKKDRAVGAGVDI